MRHKSIAFSTAAGITAVVLLGGCGGLGPLTVDSFVNGSLCGIAVRGAHTYYALWTVAWNHGGTVRVSSVHLAPARNAGPIQVVRYYAQAPNGDGPGTGKEAAGPVGGTPVTAAGAVEDLDGSPQAFLRATGQRQADGVTIGRKRVTFGFTTVGVGIGHTYWKGLDITYFQDGSTRTQLIAPTIAVYSAASKDDSCPDNYPQ